MINQSYIVITIFVIFLIFVVFLTIQVLRLKKRLDLLLKRGNKNLERILESEIKQLGLHTKQIEGILKELENLKQISQNTFQKLGIVRFNPFKEVGGDQSFSIALLDAKNNGFVITSHYGRETNRVYAKPIENGRSTYKFSEEEKMALEKAIKNNNGV